VIVETRVNDRPAVVAYMNDDFELVDKDKATLVKLTFTDNGEVVYLVPTPTE
jgi:hypothetical protein